MGAGGKARTILVLGSGPIRIGQAAEFDYAGSQACRALREEGHRVLLLNSNPATIQTDRSCADEIFLRPLLPEVVEEILEEHRPDGVVATLGGQTALNLCVECARRGIFDRTGCEVLGTSPEAVERAEGREAFRAAMIGAGQPVVPSASVADPDQARAFAASAAYPLIFRPDFTLGGTGNAVIRSPEELEERVAEGLRASPVGRGLLERYLEGWREIELEIVRDGEGNALCVCGMENVDPMGVHTGDSVVVSPVLTLTDRQWQRLRSSALAIVAALDVRGACNVQFALSPDGEEHAVIEVNPRASRSSALASKATGYPIARIAARIALGRSLTEMANPITGVGSALSEPALDYVVVKVPSWPFEAFPQADPTLGTRMKATGEIMAIGLTFAQALMRAYRSLEGRRALPEPRLRGWDEEALWDEILRPTHRRLESATELMRRGTSATELAARSGISPYFLEQLARIARSEIRLERIGALPDPLARTRAAETVEAAVEARRLGFPLSRIASALGLPEPEVEKRLEREGCGVGYREVDGCAGEIPSGSGYWYGAYGVAGEPPSGSGGLAVLGSGAIRIAQGVEFDYCCVKAVEALRARGIRAVMINTNPETVSTDPDVSDALYLEPPTPEDVLPVLRREGIRGVLAAYGGQSSLKLGLALAERGVSLTGPSPDAIDAAEERGRFADLLTRLDIPHPEGAAVTSESEARELADRLGFPLMVRPSFVIGGVAMRTVFDPEELIRVLREAFAAEPGQTVLIDRFLPGREFELDACCDGADVLIPGIFEHIDPAGVHSGDSIACFPDLSLTDLQRNRMLEIVRKLSGALALRGPLNVQFVLHEGVVHVIEANPRASRTVPIVCKAADIPLVDLTVGTALGEPLREAGYGLGLLPRPPRTAVKVPVFSTEKLPGLDPRLGPRMLSTGEALGLRPSFAEALREGLLGAGWRLPERGRLLLSVSDGAKAEAPRTAAAYAALGWSLDATPGTADRLARWGLRSGRVGKGEELLAALRGHSWDLVVNVPGPEIAPTGEGARLRRAAVEEGIPILHTLEAAEAVALGLAAGNRAG